MNEDLSNPQHDPAGVSLAWDPSAYFALCEEGTGNRNTRDLEEVYLPQFPFDDISNICVNKDMDLGDPSEGTMVF